MSTRSSARSGLVIATCIAVFGCASTKLSSQRHPALALDAYSAIVVEALLQDLDLRRECERTVQKSIQSKGYTCYSASDLFFVGRKYSGSEVASVFQEHGIGALLTITVTGSGRSSMYTPQTQRTEAEATLYGNTLSGSSTTTTYGGYNTYKPWASFEARVTDAATGEIVWYATAGTGGNAYASGKTLVKSAGKKVAEQLVKDRILKKNQAQE